MQIIPLPLLGNLASEDAVKVEVKAYRLLFKKKISKDSKN